MQPTVSTNLFRVRRTPISRGNWRSHIPDFRRIETPMIVDLSGACGMGGLVTGQQNGHICVIGPADESPAHCCQTYEHR